jgi:hypothetical protein
MNGDNGRVKIFEFQKKKEKFCGHLKDTSDLGSSPFLEDVLNIDKTIVCDKTIRFANETSL